MKRNANFPSRLVNELTGLPEMLVHVHKGVRHTGEPSQGDLDAILDQQVGVALALVAERISTGRVDDRLGQVSEVGGAEEVGEPRDLFAGGLVRGRVGGERGPLEAVEPRQAAPVEGGRPLVLAHRGEGRLGRRRVAREVVDDGGSGGHEPEGDRRRLVVPREVGEGQGDARACRDAADGDAVRHDVEHLGAAGVDVAQGREAVGDAGGEGVLGHQPVGDVDDDHVGLLADVSAQVGFRVEVSQAPASAVEVHVHRPGTLGVGLVHSHVEPGVGAVVEGDLLVVYAADVGRRAGAVAVQDRVLGSEEGQVDWFRGRVGHVVVVELLEDGVELAGHGGVDGLQGLVPVRGARHVSLPGPGL